MKPHTVKAACIAALLAFALSGEAGADAATANGGGWITSWAATPAPRWGSELPAAYDVPETLQNRTIRQVARISTGGAASSWFDRLTMRMDGLVLCTRWPRSPHPEPVEG